MRLIDWFLQFLKKNEYVEISPIKLGSLAQWLEQQSQELVIKSNLNEILPEYLEKLKEKRWLLECYLDKWEEKVEDEEIESFFLKTRELLDKVTFPEKIDFLYTLKLNFLIEETIESLILEIEKSSFAHEFNFILSEKEKNSEHEITVNPLLKELIEINGLIGNMEQKINQSGLRTIENLTSKELELTRTATELEELELQLQHKKEKLSNAEERRNEKEQEFSELKTNPDYQLVQQKESEKQALITSIEEKQESFNNLFVQFKQLLEQHKELYPENKIVNSYLDDPHSAFLEDEGLAIIHILQHCKAALKDEKFTVDENKEEIVKNLEKSCSGYLTELHHQYFSLLRKKKQFDSSVEDKDFAVKLEEAQYRLDHFSKQVEALQDVVTSLENQIDETKEKRLATKRLFENMVRMSFEKGIEIMV